jgi:hypothetical protein
MVAATTPATVAANGDCDASTAAPSLAGRFPLPGLASCFFRPGIITVDYAKSPRPATVSPAAG